MTLLTRTLLLLAFLVSTGLPAKALLGPNEMRPNARAVHFARTHDIALDGWELAPAGETSRTGDRLTVLFVIREGEKDRQWLVEFRMATLTEREAKSKPGTGLGLLSLFQTSLKTDTGHEFSFEQVPVALEIFTHGPFAGDDSQEIPATTTAARAVATRDYLAHGLAPMAKIELRLRAAGKKNPGLSLMFHPKYPAEQMAATKARAKEAGFTEEDERTYAEAIYAIVQFGNLAFKLRGMTDITHEMADSPTLFSGAFTNLVWPDLTLEDSENWKLPDMQIYRLPYRFLSKTKASGVFYFTDARPPLQNTAGFLGMTVESTSKEPGKDLIMRVLSSRRGVLP